MIEAPSAAGPVAPSIAAARFRIHDLDIQVETDDAEAAQAVQDTYAAFAVPLSEPDGRTVLITHRRVAGRSPILSLLDRVVDVVLQGMAERGILVTHAGVVVIDGRAILLSGRSGAGKSTLTLALVRAGAGWLTDDLALIEPTALAVLPYPRAIHVSPATTALMPELAFLHDRPRLTLGGDSEWSATANDVERAFGGTLAPATRLAGVILLDGRPDPARSPVLQPVPAALATMELLRETPATARDMRGTMATLAAITPRVACARLQGGRLDATADLVRAWAAGLP